MTEEDRRRTARQLFRRGYRAQTEGEIDLAVLLYRQSIDLFPTAEAVSKIKRLLN